MLGEAPTRHELRRLCRALMPLPSPRTLPVCPAYPSKDLGAMFSASKSCTGSRSSRQTLPPVLTKAPSSAQAPRIVCFFFFSLSLSLSLSCSVSLSFVCFASFLLPLIVCVSGLLLFTLHVVCLSVSVSMMLSSVCCLFFVLCPFQSGSLFLCRFFVRSLSINLATVCMYIYIYIYIYILNG